MSNALTYNNPNTVRSLSRAGVVHIFTATVLGLSSSSYATVSDRQVLLLRAVPPLHFPHTSLCESGSHKAADFFFFWVTGRNGMALVHAAVFKLVKALEVVLTN